MIGLYLNPPAHAAVFCVDEKTAIQALDRKDRMLPLSPGRAESHGFEYKRNGTLSLFAALNTATGEVLGMTAPRHTSAQFVAFLADVVASQPEGKPDPRDLRQRQQRTRPTQSMISWPSTRNVQIHYTPTYSSWLNQVENWFSRIQRDVISPRRLHQRQRPRQEAHALYPRIQQESKPIKWKYDNPAIESGAIHLVHRTSDDQAGTRPKNSASSS